jgi:hypothetical protein
MNRVKGHAWRPTKGGDGRALCECGKKSQVLPSTAARKRWHREHKEAVRDIAAAQAVE